MPSNITLTRLFQVAIPHLAKPGESGQTIDPCPADLFVSSCHSFKAGIVNAMTSFK